MKKFTQEEYEELVEISENSFGNSIGYSSKFDKSVMEEIRETHFNLSEKINNDDMVDKAVALMNPYTRELVYDDLVEEEDKFVWQYAGKNVINKEDGEWYLDDSYEEAHAIFTENQIKNSPFDISKFEKINASDFYFDF